MSNANPADFWLGFHYSPGIHKKKKPMFPEKDAVTLLSLSQQEVPKEVPKPRLDPAWKKVNLGLQLIFWALVAPFVCFPCLSILVGLVALILGLNDHVTAWFSYGILGAFGILYWVGLMLGFTVPDPLAKGYQAGAFLSPLIAIGLVFFFFQVSETIRGDLRLALLSLWILINLVVLAKMVFDILFLKRICQLFSQKEMAANCHFFLFFVVIWMSLQLTITVTQYFDLDYFAVYLRSILFILSMLGIFLSYLYYIGLLNETRIMITAVLEQVD
jgi:hypothetical protein